MADIKKTGQDKFVLVKKNGVLRNASQSIHIYQGSKSAAGCVD